MMDRTTKDKVKKQAKRYATVKIGVKGTDYGEWTPEYKAWNLAYESYLAGFKYAKTQDQ